MDSNDSVAAAPVKGEGKRRGWKRRWLLRLTRVALALVLIWIVLVYLILPWMWTHYEHHPALADAPKTTMTSEGFAGDPLNVGVVGTKAEVLAAFAAAKWTPADRITLRSSLRIGESVMLHREYDTAPVSPLFVWGRRQDLAFQMDVGGSAKQRHHVRLWLAPENLWLNGRPLWEGSVTFDQSVGFSHYTGQITHHVAPDVDADREALLGDLIAAGVVARRFNVTGVGFNLDGRNGEGDWYFTDGEMGIVELRAEAGGVTATAPGTVVEESPPAVEAKDKVFEEIRSVLGR